MEVGGYPSRPGLSEEGTGGNEAMATQAALRRAQAALGMLQGATRIIDFVGVANPMAYGPPLEYGVISGTLGPQGGDSFRGLHEVRPRLRPRLRRGHALTHPVGSDLICPSLLPAP
jgi:hypothetical protein